MMELWQILRDEYLVYHLENPEQKAKSRINGARDKENELKLAIEELSEGENTVLFDSSGTPNIMYRLKTITSGDILENGGTDEAISSFKVGNKIIPEILVSKYLNTFCNGIMASLPMAVPERIQNFTQAEQKAFAKGENWRIMPFQLQMAIALWSKKHCCMPHGNNDLGEEYFHREEKGISAGNGLTLTGSGSVHWAHNGRYTGIFDMNGNLNEWVSGFRLLNGQLQFIIPQELYKSSTSITGEGSDKWKAMSAEGGYVDASCGDTLHYQGTERGISIGLSTGEDPIGECAFGKITSSSSSIPKEAYIVGVCPEPGFEAKGCDMEGWRWVSTKGEALPLCGGAYRAINHAGALFVGTTKPRNVEYNLAGMRAIYIDPTYLKEE